MIWLALGLVIFLGIHCVRMVAPGWREARIAAMGEGPWKGLYALISLAGFVLIVVGFGIARQEAPVLYIPPIWLSHVALLLMALSFIVLAASQLPAGRIKQAARHPMLLAVKLWALAHLLANGDAASALLFVAFLGFAVWNRIDVKRRGEPDPVATSASADLWAVVIGLAAWWLFWWKLHEWLIGVAPIA